MTGFSRHLTGKIYLQSLWVVPEGLDIRFVTGEDQIMTGKHAKPTGFSRHLVTG